MKRFMSGVFATILGASMTIGTFIPAGAAPMVSRPATVSQSDVTQVQERRIRRAIRRDFRQDRRQDRRDFRRSVRQDRGDFYRGHRGYRDYRRGYRRHNGYWFPAAAFITGAIVGGTINNSNSAHVQSCYARYRSYRASDNTYQPTNGPRRQCN